MNLINKIIFDDSSLSMRKIDVSGLCDIADKGAIFRNYVKYNNFHSICHYLFNFNVGLTYDNYLM